MTSLTLSILAAAIALGSPITTPSTYAPEPASAEIGYLAVDDGINLRRMVVRHTEPRPTILFLHGFPETLYAWQDISAELAEDYELHAFDWPGFGLSSRPADGFDYSPRGYARILRQYIDKARIDRSRLVIYATDIGGLPALLAALEDPDIARTIIVGDFAPFDRPQFMQERLQALKSSSTNDEVRIQFNAGRDEILANAMRRGLSPEEQFEVAPAYRADMAAGWQQGGISSADAFARYYAAFARDQENFEAKVRELKTPVSVVWGAKDIYIDPAMGAEFAGRINARLSILPGVGHYPHLQDPKRTAAEIRTALVDQGIAS
jgi:pimeloyl-ACP methyl ester carboxylesterase